MGKAKLPDFPSMIDLNALKEQLHIKGYSVKDVSAILKRESVGNVRSILNGTVNMKTSDLTRLLNATGIKLTDITKQEFKHII